VTYLIAVDGLDGCGKDTHALRMKAALEQAGAIVILMGHPSERFFGRMSKGALRRSGPIAMVAATAFYTLDVLSSVKRLRRTDDETVIFVRYLLGTAYLPRSFARYAYSFFRRLLPFPDLALFIDIKPSVAVRRIELRDSAREMFETEERLAKAREIVLTLLADEWEVVDNSIDGEGPFEEVLGVLSRHGLI
jgi:dTMP kinase